ncbi:sugar kinase [uncultured Maribacter sp.]|uniref:carbohydrate kinase family protein n=1 Tax=uncultured Maribacter sp. TaxID=431308 RepID=UPI00263139BF|nr:sugar kinase [uncultured Maribacter sp.]
MKNNRQEIDVLCVGEVLIDFIGHQSEVLINETRDYHRYLGGSPTNVAMNVARLGLKTNLVATVGNDGFGEYILRRLTKAGVITENVKKIEDKPTSVIFVSRTQATPEFIPFRSADFFITEDQITKETLLNTKIYHTTCFALTQEPAQSTILQKAEEAFNLGCKLSIDVNYAKKMWKSKEEALKIIKAYCKYNPLVKVSVDDMLRLFGETLPDEEIFNFFHSLGVDVICLTMGSKGVKLSQKGEETIWLPAIKVTHIMDATGAGDAFWSGFLYAYVKEKSIKKCLEIALQLAALKLQNVGRLPDQINILSKLL